MRMTRKLAFGALAGCLLTLLPPSLEAHSASPTTATLNVQKGGNRTAPQTVGGLAGATFDFYAGTAGSPPAAGATPTASCTTTAPLGQCGVDVPGRSGPNQGYWIVERSAPAGYTAPQTLDTGPGTGPTNEMTYNRYFTGAVFNNQTYTFPVASTGNTNDRARGSSWADIKDNPALPNRCGLNIALLIDTSGSIAPFLSQVKSAANGFVDALTGTPSRIAVYRFATNASTVLGPTPVSEAAGADVLKAAINGLSASGGTNWDAGLYQIAAAPTTYDAVLMLTDGNPTYYGPSASGPGNYTRFREIEAGIFSANAVKSFGTKIVAVGVGAGISDSEHNLQAISGPVRGTDFVQTDYAALAAVFREIALKTCSGSISVVKKVIPPGGDLTDGVPTGGWTFGTATPNVTPTSATTAMDSGAVSFSADLQGAPSLPVTITETQQTGYTLVQNAGANATCTSDGSPVTSTNSGALGFTVDAEANAIVSCVVYNMAPNPPAQVRVTKTWVINGTTYADPAQPDEFQAALQLTGQTNPDWNQIYGGYQQGDSVTVGETVDMMLLPPGCTVTRGGDLGNHTLAAGLNTYAVRNTVTCTTTLTLVKTVINPYGTPEPADSWTLSAYPPGSTTPLITGTTGVSGEVQPGTTYSLGETSVPGYVQQKAADVIIVPPATGSWNCGLRGRTLPGAPVPIGVTFDGIDGTVAVAIGQDAVCTTTNIALPAVLTLKKQVSNTHGGTAGPTAWVLSAVPQGDEDGDAVPISGRDGDLSVTQAIAIPGVPYLLGEAGPAGYTEAGDPECVLTGTDTVVPLTGGAFTAEIAQDITCTFRNVDSPRPPPIIPVTGANVLGVATSGLLVVLIGAGMVYVARRPRS